MATAAEQRHKRNAIALLNMAMALAAAGEAVTLSINYSTLSFDVSDEPYTITGAERISVSDSADTSGTGIYELTLAVSDGHITLSQITGLTFSVGDGTADPIMTFQAIIADINAALDGMILDGMSAGTVTFSIPFSSSASGDTVSEVNTINVVDVDSLYAGYYDFSTNYAAYDGAYATYGAP